MSSSQQEILIKNQSMAKTLKDCTLEKLVHMFIHNFSG